MTQKEINELSVFMDDNSIFISKMLKNGTFSNVRKDLTDSELMNIMLFTARKKFMELNSPVITINMDDKPIIEVKLIQEEAKEENAEDSEETQAQDTVDGEKSEDDEVQVPEADEKPVKKTRKSSKKK